MSFRIVLVACAALLGSACASKEDAAKLKVLEDRVARLEARLADLPAATADLDQASLDELSARLDSPDAIVRYRAGRAFAARILEARVVLVDLLTNGTKRQKHAAAQIFAESAPPEAIGELVAAHGRELDAKSRAWLDVALARTGKPEAVDPLVADLAHPSQTVRIAAVQGLAKLKDARSAMPLVKATIEGDPIVASLARQALRGLNETTALFLEGQWDVFGPRDRQSILEAMGPIPGAQIESFLEDRLADASPRVALEAALQLARRGSLAGKDVAIERLRSSDPVISRVARDVLDAIEAHHGSIAVEDGAASEGADTYSSGTQN